MTTDRSWMAQAICAQISIEAWYPEQGRQPKEAVKICHECPEKLTCLDYVMTLELGLKRHDRSGLWAGLFPQQRIAYEPQWLAEQDVAA
jgi:WhiB family redox-sensing transcriptional regulator